MNLPRLQQELAELTTRSVEGDLDAAGRQRLADLLAEHPTLVDDYVELLNLRATIRFDAMTATPIPSAHPVFTNRGRRFRITHAAWSIAAAVLLTAAAVAIVVFVIKPQSEAPNPKISAPVATLIDADTDVFVNEDVANPGSDYSAGEYAIDGGSAQFMLTNRVAVDLKGKTRLRMHHAMSASLDTGSASFNCPPGTEGFTVHLPDGSRVVDLGTAFDLHVDGGRSTLRVSKGSVQWLGRDKAADPVVMGAGESARIVDGQFERTHATVVYEHDFVGPNRLNGIVPDAGFGDAKWVAAPGIGADGSIAGGGAGTATLAFKPANGFVYTLEASLTEVKSLAGSDHWLAFGFAVGQGVTTGTVGDDENRFLEGRTTGRAWMMIFGSGAPTEKQNHTFLGRPGPAGGLGRGLPWTDWDHGIVGDLDLRIVLDTTGGPGQWSATWYARRPGDDDYTTVRPATPLLNEKITSVGFGKSNKDITARITRFALTQHAMDPSRDNGSETQAPQTSDPAPASPAGS